VDRHRQPEPSYFLTSRSLALTVHTPAGRKVRAIFERDGSPTAIAFGPDTQLTPRVHGETPPEGSKVYGGR
jgi:hypothetical protein